MPMCYYVIYIIINNGLDSRGSGAGLCLGVGFLGGVVAPYLPVLVKKRTVWSCRLSCPVEYTRCLPFGWTT